MTTPSGRDQALKILGEMAITFAGIEHSTAVLLNHMVDGEALVKPLLIDRLPLAQAIGICREAGTHYFEDDPDQLNKLKELLKRIDARRVERNRFVHGQWTIDDSGHVTIATFKLKRSKHNTHWEYLHQERMILRDLHEHAEDVTALWNDLCDFVNQIIESLD